MTKDRIERAVYVDAPVERVWAVLTEADHLGRWFAEDAQVDLRAGGALVLSWKEHGTYTCTVERVEPPRRFAWRGSVHPDVAAKPGTATLVEFTLEPEGTGTRVTVVESGFAALDMSEAERDTWYEGNVDGWRTQTENLRAYAEASAS